MNKSLKNIIIEELRSVEEVVSPEEVNLSSFEFKEELNAKIWRNDKKINPKVREKLLKIADDFIDFLDIPWVKLSDVTLTGSLANYNWSNFSDVDLHLLIDFSEINDNEELVRDYLDSKRKLWNDTHNINIFGFNVEIYCQDINQEHYSSGVFSLEDNKWLTEPTKEIPKLDKKLIKKKASDFMNKIDVVIDLYEKGKYQEVLDEYDKIWKKIKDMRQSGLERGGEFSYENIVFKVLRRTDYIDKFMKIKTDAYDTLNSL